VYDEEPIQLYCSTYMRPDAADVVLIQANFAAAVAVFVMGDHKAISGERPGLTRVFPPTQTI
jgi:hypothetical protein